MTVANSAVSSYPPPASQPAQFETIAAYPPPLQSVNAESDGIITNFTIAVLVDDASLILQSVPAYAEILSRQAALYKGVDAIILSREYIRLSEYNEQKHSDLSRLAESGVTIIVTGDATFTELGDALGIFIPEQKVEGGWYIYKSYTQLPNGIPVIGGIIVSDNNQDENRAILEWVKITRSNIEVSIPEQDLSDNLPVGLNVDLTASNDLLNHQEALPSSQISTLSNHFVYLPSALNSPPYWDNNLSIRENVWIDCPYGYYHDLVKPWELIGDHSGSEDYFSFEFHQQTKAGKSYCSNSAYQIENVHTQSDLSLNLVPGQLIEYSPTTTTGTTYAEVHLGATDIGLSWGFQTENVSVIDYNDYDTDTAAWQIDYVWNSTPAEYTYESIPGATFTLSESWDPYMDRWVTIRVKSCWLCNTVQFQRHYIYVW